MREVFIISTGEILNGKTAGSRRMLNFAKSMAAGNITVYLCSLAGFKGDPSEMNLVRPGVFTLMSGSKESLRKGTFWQFLRTVNRFLSRGEAEKVIYLYPTTFVLKDFIYLLYFKFLKRYRFYCEINELRRAIPLSSQPPSGSGHRILYLFKNSKDFVVFSLNEIQTIFYDGITVISTNLEKYFARYTKRMIRVPILCDADEIDPLLYPPVFDGGTFKICFAGYIKCDKEGFDLVYEALSELNTRYRVELYLYGNLEEEDSLRLRHLSEKYEIREKVFYQGNMDPEELKFEFSRYHLLILPRPLNMRTKYGFSTKLSEYLVSGVPVLLTDVSDNALYIKDNFNGYIIPPGSAGCIAEKLEYIILNYNDQAGKIVKNAHNTVIEQLDIRLFTGKFADFFFNDKNKVNQPA